MEKIKSGFNYLRHGFNRQPEINRRGEALVQEATLPSKVESKAAILAEQEIGRVFDLIKDGRHKDAVKTCRDVHTTAVTNGNQSDIAIIKDLLFDAALGISLIGDNKTAREILMIVNSPSVFTAEQTFATGETYHRLASVCWNTLSSSNTSISIYSRELEKLLLESIPQKEYLKCTPYFLANVYKNALYGVLRNDDKAYEYFELAEKRKRGD